MRAERTFLFIHGFGGFAGIWAWQVAHFKEQGRVIAVDLPGHGAAPWHGEDLAGMAAGIGRVLDHADVQKDVALVASSFGGLVALELERQRPGILSSMTLAGSSPRFTFTEDFPAGLTPRRIEALSVRVHKDPAAALESFFRSLFTPGERDSVQYGLIIRDLCRRAPVPGVEALEAFLEILKTADLRAVFRSITVPVQFVLGDQDHICPPAVIPFLSDMLPSVRVDVIRGTGHLPFLSRPREFNACVEDFIG